MKTIALKSEITGKFMLYLNNPEKGELLTTEQLEKLLPYVLHAVKKKCSPAMADKITSKLVVSGQKLSLANLSEDDRQHESKLLDKVVSACNSFIKEKLIVPQYMGKGPELHHRVMNFEATDHGIEVKYTELHEDNHLGTAMEDLKTLYPDVEVANTNSISI